MIVRRWLVAVGLWLVASGLLAQDVSSVAEHAPANSCFAAASGDVAATCAAFQRSRLGATFCGPAFEPLIEELRRREISGPLHLQPTFGFDWRDLAGLHAAGGLFLFPLGDAKLGGAWIFAGAVSPTGPLATAEAYFIKRNFARSTLQYKGATLTVLKPPAQEQASAVRILFAAPTFYGVANSPEAAKAALDVVAAGSLAASPLWHAAQPGGTPGDATLVVRPMELWEQLRKMAAANRADEPAAAEAEGDEPDRDPLDSARQLGLEGVQGVAAEVRFAKDAGRDWQVRGRLIVPGSLDKALRLLELRQGALAELPDWIAADVTSASLWQWDFPRAMQGFGSLFDEANEPGPDGVGLFEDMLDGLRDDPEGVQVDLRQDVFAQLGPEVLNVTDRGGQPSEELPKGDRSLYVVRVRDLARVIDSLERFYRGDDRVRHEKSGAYHVWTVDEGASLFVEGESDSVVSVRALAVGEDRMLFGTDESLLRSALAGKPAGAPLKDDAQWSRLWQQIKEQPGEAAALWSLLRLEAVLGPSYERATSAEPADDDPMLAGLWRVLLFGTPDPEADVPREAAPPLEAVRPALPPASTILTVEPGGFRVTTSALGGAEGF